MEDQSVNRTSNIFELSSFQRRLRHLKLIAVRNLKCQYSHGKELSRLETYFTLHKDRNSTEFYTSEKITGSLNPSWQSFDMSRYEDIVNTTEQTLLVRVWVKYQTRTLLLVDWMVDLTALEYLTEKLQQDKGVKYASNTVLFGLFDHFFRAPEQSKKGPDLSHVDSRDLSSESVSDHLPPSNMERMMLRVDATSVRKSYTTSSLNRIYTVLRAIKQTQVSVHKVRKSIEDKLLSSQETTVKKAAHEDLILKREQLRNEVEWRTASLNKRKDSRDKQHTSNQSKDSTLQQNLTSLEEKKRELQEKKKAYNQARESLIKESAQLFIRRKQLIAELATFIYPITQRKNLYFIANINLPNSEDFQGKDDTTIAVALGYTCHFVLMMSHIMDIPLRYNMEYRVSKSVIRDHIHTKLTSDKDREFPLYSKGKERFQFNYGVFILNKNISQMRFYMGQGTTDLRTTLQNIKSLLETRLGLKTDNPLAPARQLSEVSDRQFSELDKTDTQSSLSSFGRVSLPHDTRAEENTPPCRDTSDDIFRGSNDDNFFKISNPVSERLADLDFKSAISDEASNCDSTSFISGPRLMNHVNDSDLHKNGHSDDSQTREPGENIYEPVQFSGTDKSIKTQKKSNKFVT